MLFIERGQIDVLDGTFVCCTPRDTRQDGAWLEDRNSPNTPVSNQPVSLAYSKGSLAGSSPALRTSI